MLGKVAMVRLVLRVLIAISALANLSTQADAESEIVIAIRYLQVQGKDDPVPSGDTVRRLLTPSLDRVEVIPQAPLSLCEG